MTASRDRFPAIALVLVLTIGAACDDNRGGDVPAICGELAKLPGVRVIDAWGFDSMWPFFGPEAIRADLEVGKGGHLVLCRLTPEVIKGQGAYIIARVGRWAPEAWADRDMGKARYVAGCPNSVDVAPGSPFLELVPFGLTFAADAVARYDELNALIESWPDRTTDADAKDGHGRIHYRKTLFEDSFVGK
jgi:hypothetical protein